MIPQLLATHSINPCYPVNSLLVSPAAYQHTLEAVSIIAL